MSRAVATSIFLLLSVLHADERQITIYFTSNTRGETQPCGCAVENLGGLAKRSTLFKQADRANSLFFDVGDTFFISDVLPAHMELEAQKKADAIARVYDLLSYDQILLGDLDRGLSDQSRKNLKIIEEVQPKVILKNGLTVLVYADGPEIKSAKKEKRQGDLRILLAHRLGEPDHYLKLYPEMDLILLGHSGVLMTEPIKADSLLAFEAGERGQYVGKIHIGIDRASSREKLNSANQIHRMKLENEIRFAAPDQKEELNQALRQMKRKPKKWYAYEPIPLTAMIDSDRQIEKMISK